MSKADIPDLKNNQDAPPPPDNPQELIGFMSNDDWQALLADVNDQIIQMEALAFPQVKEQVFQLLAGIDTIHREALHRLVRLFKGDVLEQVVTDPAIHTLMELYDLLPPNVKRAEPSEYHFELPGAGLANQPPPKAPHGIAHWVPALKSAEAMADNSLQECFVDGRRLVVCQVEGQFYAMDSACVQDAASLAQGSLYKLTLSCPHHTGCHYDIRSGGQIGGAKSLECYNVTIDDAGRLMVGFDMDFKPNLPAF